MGSPVFIRGKSLKTLNYEYLLKKIDCEYAIFICA